MRVTPRRRKWVIEIKAGSVQIPVAEFFYRWEANARFKALKQNNQAGTHYIMRETQ